MIELIMYMICINLLVVSMLGLSILSGRLFYYCIQNQNSFEKYCLFLISWSLLSLGIVCLITTLQVFQKLRILI